MAYKYRGTKTIAAEEAEANENDPRLNGLPKGCNGFPGQSGVKAHRKRGETPCLKCSVARTAYDRAYYHGLIDPKRPASCGTVSGLNRHYRNKEQPCQDCLNASAEYQRNRRNQMQGKAA